MLPMEEVLPIFTLFGSFLMASMTSLTLLYLEDFGTPKAPKSLMSMATGVTFL